MQIFDTSAIWTAIGSVYDHFGSLINLVIAFVLGIFVIEVIINAIKK